MDTSQNHSPFFSRTATRARRQMNFEVEPQHLYDEFMGILDIALNDASRAGVMMQEIAHRELHPPGGTPIRNQQRNNNRITPYSAERRPSNRFGYSNPPQGMFDTRKNLFNAPVTPTRPLQYFSPATLSCSTNSSTLSKAPQQSTEFPHPATQSRSTDSFTSSSYNFNPATFSRSVYV
uniref:Uncharacterized protein n=1 Tax=Panagrolaimus sp. ES5 TaxID=591445 RepID=A0AC34FQP5_9BILA